VRSSILLPYPSSPSEDTCDGATLLSRGLSEMGSRGRAYQTDDRGRRTTVVLPIAEYDRLLEDLHDLAVVAERRDGSLLDRDDLARRLAGDGLV